MRGRLYVGTSGYAYPAWAPRFYPVGLRADGLLPAYAARLSACELNSTYYRQPKPDQIAGWVRATPPSFRFTVKAHRGGSMRAYATEPASTLEWMVGGLNGFGERLGCVLFRVPQQFPRDDARLDQLVSAWPASVPVAFEFQDASWQVDEVYQRIRAVGGVLVASELEDDPAPPPITVTGSFVYLRLRRHAYTATELDAWAARIEPFLEGGLDAFAFFRHDGVGAGPEFALGLAARLDRNAGNLAQGR